MQGRCFLIIDQSLLYVYVTETTTDLFWRGGTQYRVNGASLETSLYQEIPLESLLTHKREKVRNWAKRLLNE